MKYYEISYPNELDEDVFEVLSEMDIIRQYWKHWYSKMVEKFGPDHTDITVENCIEDWVVVHWAVEVKNSGGLCGLLEKI